MSNLKALVEALSVYRSSEPISCAEEPLGFLSQVQPHGCMLFINSRSEVEAAAGCMEKVFGENWKEGLGKHLSTWSHKDLWFDVLQRMRSQCSKPGQEFILQKVLAVADEFFDIRVVNNSMGLMIDIEPSIEQIEEFPETEFYSEINGAACMTTLNERFLEIIDRLINFDRVLVYRFEDDHSGVVIAERHTSDADSLLGLRFPAHDIPENARKLYLKKKFRFIYDAKAVPEKVSCGFIDSPRVDLSLSELRQVSPLHVEYMLNLGIRSSFSVSILDGHKLWGLMICHNITPKPIAQALRSRCLELAILYIKRYQKLKIEQAKLEWSGLADPFAHLRESLYVIATGKFDFNKLLAPLGKYIGCSGLALFLRGDWYLNGLVPKPKEMLFLWQLAGSKSEGSSFMTHELPNLVMSDGPYKGEFCGLLTVGNYKLFEFSVQDVRLFCFRGEQSTEHQWAGKPSEEFTVNSLGQKTLAPRKDFKPFVMNTKKKSLPWSSLEQEKAQHLILQLLLVLGIK